MVSYWFSHFSPFPFVDSYCSWCSFQTSRCDIHVVWANKRYNKLLQKQTTGCFIWHIQVLVRPRGYFVSYIAKTTQPRNHNCAQIWQEKLLITTIMSNFWNHRRIGSLIPRADFLNTLDTSPCIFKVSKKVR